MAAIRRAEAVWRGDLIGGKGEVTAVSSRAFSQLPVTWASRTEEPNGRTSPEELIAAAHAGCFAMAFSHGLAQAGTPPRQLDVTATVTFDRVGDGFRVVSSALSVRGSVPDLDQARFQELADAAKDGCPVSQALKGNVELSVSASLQS